jgi:hypothetical protein
MTVPEFQAWVEFYRLAPFDDRSRYHRPAALVASVGGLDLTAALDWLDHKSSPEAKYSEVDLSMMKAFGLKPPRKD